MAKFTRNELKNRVVEVKGMSELQADKPFQTSYGTIMKVSKGLGAEMGNCSISIEKKDLKGEGISLGSEVEVKTTVKIGGKSFVFSIFYTRIMTTDNKIESKLEWLGDKEKERQQFPNMTLLQNVVLGM